MDYLQLTTSSRLPDITALRPFKAVVIVEEPISPERRESICGWLVDSGCLYAMAWGRECDPWRDSLRRANEAACAGGPIPDDRVVIVTTHAKEPLRETFWFCKHTAMHPCAALENCLLLHLSPQARARRCKDEYLNA